jgi:aspartyl protease family protein
MAGWLAILLFVAIGMLILLKGEADTIAGFDIRDVILGSTGLAMLLLVSSGLRGSYQGRVLRALRDAIVWAGLLLAVVVGYSYRAELMGVMQRVTGELLPPGVALRSDTVVEGERAVRIRKRPDGHFVAQTAVNGLALSMLVDTGASTVVLRPADAQRLGIDVEKLRYSVPVQTANGTTYAAAVRLKSLAVGPIAFRDVDALVAKPGALKDSLLGMSFLGRLRSYEFSGDYLTLRI